MKTPPVLVSLPCHPVQSYKESAFEPLLRLPGHPESETVAQGTLWMGCFVCDVFQVLVLGKIQHLILIPAHLSFEY